MENFNDELELDLELIQCARWGTCFYGMLAESGAADPNVLRFKSLYDEAFYEALPDINSRFELAANTWQRGFLSRRDSHRINVADRSGPLHNPYNTGNIG